MPNPRYPFKPDTIYHVYNHGNGDDLIFRKSENYRFFLKRFKVYISPIAWIYAYCLMPNHFHFLIRIKSEEELIEYFHIKYPEKFSSSSNQRSAMSLKDIADHTSNQFKNFLISYSKSFNKMYNRRGSLFLDNIKRMPIQNDDYFTNMIRYIHFNPVLHNFTDNLHQWKFSSIHSYHSDKRSLILKQDVFEWFGGVGEFKKFHKSIQKDEFDSMKHLIYESIKT